MDTQQYVNWFRTSAPYINAHRGNTLVVQFDGAAALDSAFHNLIHDLALLHSLGMRLVIVHGARPQVVAAMQAQGLELDYANGLRVTTPEAMELAKQAAAGIKLDIEALLSMGLANSPMAGAAIRVTSGNFITAKPMGVRNGIDYGLTGEVRRIDADAIGKHLALNQVVVISPIGFSPTGEIFNLSAEDIATEIAIELHASKLIFYSETGPLVDQDGVQIRQLTLEAAKTLAAEQRRTPVMQPHDNHLIDHAVRACRNGVRRCQIIDRHADGALIAELFTRDGVGTMVSADLYDSTRQATIDDVGGILELIEPLEADGTLVRRSREKLEQEIQRFLVMERDGAVIACAALYPLNDTGDTELACVAVQEDYQRANRGESLLQSAERHARSHGAQRLFVLTTQATHWFQEQGFEQVGVDDLPTTRQALYNYQRNSKVLVKSL